MKSDIQQVHEKLLSLLKDINKLCEENEIKYSLFAGSLIGAIRHKGFIPWDDDADVIFERAEFEKFSAALPPYFELYRNPWVPRFKRKGEEIYIDIFVLDQAADTIKKQKRQVLKLKFLQGTLKKKMIINKGGWMGFILSLATYVIGIPFNKKTKLRKYDAWAQRYNNQDTGYLFSSLDQFKYIGHVLPNTIIEGYKKVKFEDTELMIMSGYHTYLTKFYGDYMELPTREKRVPQHGKVND